MQPPQGLQVILFKVKPKSKKTENTLSRSTLALLAVSQLTFGFNFGFAKVVHQNYRKTINICTTIMGGVMLAFLLLGYYHTDSGDEQFRIHVILYFLQYTPTFFILFSTKYTLCEFLNDLATVEDIPQYVNYGKIGLVAWIATTFMYLVKLVSATVHCFYTFCTDSQQIIANFSVHFSILSLDAIPVANFLFFYYVHVFMKHLKDSFERREIDSNSLITTYKRLADCFDKFRSTHDWIFVWGFMTQATKWMLMIWNHLILIKSSSSRLLYACSYAWALHITMEICVPAVFAEMITVQADAIKAVLHERILVENDATKTLDLVRVLRYLKARPLLSKAWRLVPLDLRLPVVMLSMCTSYLIVIIQFTHLFV